jgi:hypothetical protein
MKTFDEEQHASIQQQIMRLEQEYKSALLQGKEFEILKNIKQHIKTLEEKADQ